MWGRRRREKKEYGQKEQGDKEDGNKEGENMMMEKEGKEDERERVRGSRRNGSLSSMYLFEQSGWWRHLANGGVTTASLNATEHQLRRMVIFSNIRVFHSQDEVKGQID